MTAEGLCGVVRGSANGYFAVELTDSSTRQRETERETETKTETERVVVKRRGTALRLLDTDRGIVAQRETETKRPRSEDTQHDNVNDQTERKSDSLSLPSSPCLSSSGSVPTEEQMIQSYTGGCCASLFRFLSFAFSLSLSRSLSLTVCL